MIDKILIQGYRKYRDITFTPNKKMNILVGDNESGKSTILEAISIALTGRIAGKPLQEEISPYWFNEKMVEEFFTLLREDPNTALPVINIEVYFENNAELARLHGANNSQQPTYACPGLKLIIKPNPDYTAEIAAYLTQPTELLPVDYYKVEWRTFADELLTMKPKEVNVAVIDSKTIRSNSGIDYHLRQMLSSNLDESDKAAAATAYRRTKEQMTATHLTSVNEKMALLEGGLNGEKLGLSMDQSSKSSWATVVAPHVDKLPFSLAGQGQQAAIKTSLAMHRHSDTANIVLVEEPENHLSHTSLNKLVDRIERLAGEDQQVFITTHNSFVLNRLGFNTLHFVSNDKISQITGVSDDTVRYFKKLPGYDTLRMVLTNKFVVLEGPSDEIMFEYFYLKKYNKTPIKDGIDVMSMRGLSLARCLELAKLLNKKCAALRDIDDENPDDIRANLGNLLEAGKRELFVGNASQGKTLEPQLISANSDTSLRAALNINSSANLLTWMTNNKTEAALRLAESTQTLTSPPYIASAIEFIHDA